MSKSVQQDVLLEGLLIHINSLLELLYYTTIRYVFSPTNDGFIGALFHSRILPYE